MVDEELLFDQIVKLVLFLALKMTVIYVLSSGQGRVGDFRGQGGRGQGIRRNRGRGRGSSGGRGGGRGAGRGRGRDEKVSAEDLDAELEKYHAEAMQIN